MCGFAGILSSHDACPTTRAVARMHDALAHRGPDGQGFASVDDHGAIHLATTAEALRPVRVALAHRRLAILDLSPASAQPMASSDGRYVLAFNGEIYNYLELREQLEPLGWRFRSQGDTEVVLAALAHWGPACLKRFVGMFALALVDTQARRLLLARDHFGIKPLYLARWQEHFVFASEIKALLELDAFPRQMHPQALHDYLATGVTDASDQTLFADVHALPPATMAELPLDQPAWPTWQRYWQVDPMARIDVPFDEAATTVRDIFVHAVTLHLRSDVEVGTSLSGGLDSSAIVAAMRTIGGPQLAIRAFTHVVDEPALAEERYARLAADHAEAQLERIVVAPEELARDLPTLIRAQDEPFRSTSIYAQRRVFERAREVGVKVMLDGQGADEMMAGYRPYLAARLGSLLRQGRLVEAARLARCASRLDGVSWRWLVARTAGFVAPSLLEPWLRRLQRALTLNWIDEDWFHRRQVATTARRFAGGPQSLRAELIRDLGGASLAMLLRYEDRNSMACSLEARVPFLTPAMAEYVLSLPEAYLIGADGTGKAVFRAATEGLVPAPILERRDKIGYATPQGRWLAALRPQVETALRSEVARQLPLRLDACRRQYDAALANPRHVDPATWRWINLILWAQQFNVSVR